MRPWFFHSLLAFVCLFLQGTMALALTTASNTADLLPDRPTHIIVAGRGDELGMLLQQSALTKARTLLSLYPSHQIIILVADEKSPQEEQSFFRKSPFNQIQSVPGALTSEFLFETIRFFKAVKSLDLFTHGTVKYGLRLDSFQERLESIDNWLSLKGHFTTDAYIFLHGCNTGFELAPALSRLLNVATLGSLTSTDFQKASSLGAFINPDYAPENTTWSSPLSYRMKPDNSPYDGYWGNFSLGGLGFFKIFCSEEQTHCAKAMKQVILEWPTSATSFQDKLFDFLCPGHQGSTTRRACELALRKGEKAFSPFRGNSLMCTRSSCDFSLVCPQFDDKCTINTDTYDSGALWKEYSEYLSAGTALP